MSATKTEPIRVVSEDPTETALLLLKRLRSEQLARGLLREKFQAKDLSPDATLIDRKANGIASAMSSAMGYWTGASASANSRILSRYYAFLHLTIAERVASVDSAATLEDAQRHTLQGHGLALFQVAAADEFRGATVGVTNGGHFSSLFRELYPSISGRILERRPKEACQPGDAEALKGESLAGLLCRVPELQPLVSEHLARPPLSFRVAARTHILSDPPRVDFLLFAHKSFVTQQLAALGLGVQTIQALESPGGSEQCYECEATYPGGDWEDALHVYRSGYSPDCIIAPVFGSISDPYWVHGIILYALSIVVRYMPALWSEISGGRLAHIYALLEYYLSVVDNIVPRLALNRLSHRLYAIEGPSKTGHAGGLYP